MLITNKIKIGDTVKIIHAGQSYSTYLDMANELKATKYKNGVGYLFFHDENKYGEVINVNDSGYYILVYFKELDREFLFNNKAMVVINNIIIVNPLDLKVEDKIKFYSYENESNHNRDVDIDKQNKFTIGSIYAVTSISDMGNGHISNLTIGNNPILDNGMSAWWGTFIYPSNSLKIRNKVRNTLTHETGKFIREENNRIWAYWEKCPHLEMYFDKDIVEFINEE